jgi:glutamyl-tRNA synthetase
MESPVKKETIRVRFPPSPTGFLQLGNIRTALFNFVFAKNNQGTFVLRIEDTDPERSKSEYEKDILESLKWLGLQWDEGPDIGGNFGPYRQSEKLEVYEKYLKKLLDEGKAFYCFCPEEELEVQRQYQLSQGQPSVYSGKCRNLSQAEVEENLRQRKSANIRFKNEAQQPIVFQDLIRGKIEFEPKLIGDFSIARNLRAPLYNFSVVVDDSEMKITHVIRGEDHISNTPKQVLIQEALGFLRPKYAHLPMILAPDHSKLSKRHGSVSVQDYRENGYLPEALINFVALLGWHPTDEKEVFSLNSLIKEFSLERVQKAGAVFNQQRLDWLNGFYIRNLSLKNLTEKCLPYLLEAGLIKISQESFPAQLIEVPIEEKPRELKYEVLETGEIVEFEHLTKTVFLYQQRLKKLSEIVELVDFFFKGKLVFASSLLAWKEMTDKELNEILEKLIRILEKVKLEDWQKENLENLLLPEAEKVGDRGKLLWPFRVALTGKEASAGPFEVAAVLGKDKTLKRLKQALELLEK